MKKELLKGAAVDQYDFSRLSSTDGETRWAQFPLEIRRGSKKRRKKKQKMLELVGISDKSTGLSSTKLSGGQKQQ